MFCEMNVEDEGGAFDKVGRSSKQAMHMTNLHHTQHLLPKPELIYKKRSCAILIENSIKYTISQ